MVSDPGRLIPAPGTATRSLAGRLHLENTRILFYFLTKHFAVVARSTLILLLQPVLPFHFFQNPLKTGRKTPDIPPDFFTACKFPKNSPIVNPYLYESTLHYLGVHIVLITSAII